MLFKTIASLTNTSVIVASKEVVLPRSKFSTVLVEGSKVKSRRAISSSSLRNGPEKARYPKSLPDNTAAAAAASAARNSALLATTTSTPTPELSELEVTVVLQGVDTVDVMASAET